MNYKIIKFISVNKQEADIIKTIHNVDGMLATRPKTLQITQYENDTGFYLFHLDSDNNIITDTYHETLDDALKQSEWEFETKESEWKNYSNSEVISK